MGEYVGKICPYCMTELKEDDAVKVCPACGIPHHKTCWEENNGCTTFGCSGQYHEPQNTTPTAVCAKCGAVIEEGRATCPKCGALKNASRANICGKCGTTLQEWHAFCPKCGQMVGSTVTVDAGVAARIGQYNEAATKKKKNILPIVIGALAIIGVAVFLLLKKPAVEEIALSRTALELKAGDSKSVFYTIYPEEASGTEVTWESSNETVATVSNNGLITGKDDGSCTISVSARGKTDSLTVTVKTGPDFNAIYQAIDGESPWAEVGADGSYLQLDTNPYDWEDDGGAYIEAYYAAEVVNTILGLPDSLTNAFGEVTGADGRQTEDYPKQGVSVSYQYYPDNGLEIIYKLLD